MLLAVLILQNVVYINRGKESLGIGKQQRPRLAYVFSVVILSFPLIQEGPLSVSGKRICINDTG